MTPFIITLEGMKDRIPAEVQAGGIVELKASEPWFWKLLDVPPHGDIRIVKPAEMPDEEWAIQYDNIVNALSIYKIAYNTQQAQFLPKLFNALVNHKLFLYCEPVHKLPKLDQGHPPCDTALIVGNGPSLHGLNRVEQTTVTFVCWHAMPKMLKKGLEITYVVHADAVKPVHDYESEPIPSHVKIIAPPTVCPEFARHHTLENPRLFGYFSAENPIHSFYAAHHNSPDHSAMGGTVASMMVQSALYAGYDKIALIGVDLSQPEPFDGAIRVLDKHGKHVYTSELWLSYKQELECIARLHPRVTFENWGETGLAINGYKDKQLEKPLIVIPDFRASATAT